MKNNKKIMIMLICKKLQNKVVISNRMNLKFNINKVILKGRIIKKHKKRDIIIWNTNI